MPVPSVELTAPAAQAPGRPEGARSLAIPQGMRFYAAMAVAALVIGALSLLLPSTPSYDPWSWLIWGREIVHTNLVTTGGPTWKPLPVMFTTLFALFGHAQPDLWLVVARAGAVATAVMVFRLGYRLTSWIGRGDTNGDEAGAQVRGGWAELAYLPAILAAVIATVGLVFSAGFIADNAMGYSEGLAVALGLIAIERHLDGHRHQAFAFGFFVALDRPEIWLFWGSYGLYLFWRDASSRKLVIGLFLLIPIMWFLPEYWGSGHFFRGVSRAHHPRKNSPAFAACPFCSLLVDHAWPTVLLRVKLAALAVVAGAAWVLLLHNQRRDAEGVTAPASQSAAAGSDSAAGGAQSATAGAGSATARAESATAGAESATAGAESATAGAESAAAAEHGFHVGAGVATARVTAGGGPAPAAGRIARIRRLGALSDPRERGLMLGAMSALLGLFWFLLIAVLTQAGFSGNNRYLIFGSTFIFIAGGVGYGWLAIWLNRRAGPLISRAGESFALSPRSVLVAGSLVSALIFLALPNFVGKNLISVQRTHRALVFQANLRRDATSLVTRFGGAQRMLRCGTVMTEGFQVPLVAWTLGVHSLDVQAPPDKSPTGPPWPRTWPNVILQARDTRHAALLPLWTTIHYWESVGAHYKVRSTKTFRMFTDCVSSSPR